MTLPINLEYKIRPVTEADWPQIAEIYQQGIDTNKATFQSECPTYAKWDIAHLDFCRLVMTENGLVVGWAALSPISERPVYAGVAEVSIYIETTHHGMGLGTRLFIDLITLSEENGIWTLQSGIMKDNLASIHLHVKCGFRVVGFREKIGLDRFGVWRDTVLMERRSQKL